MSYRPERYDAPRQSSFRRWIVALTILVWILLIGILLVRFVVRPFITGFVQQRIAESIPVGPEVADGVLPDAPPAEPGVPAVEPGSFTITEADANQWVAANRGEFQGVDDVRLRFVPGEAQADVTVAGVTSTAYAGIQVADGKIVVTNPRIDPPLSLVLDVEPFANLLQDRLNRDLATTGLTVTGATIESGQMTITVE